MKARLQRNVNLWPFFHSPFYRSGGATIILSAALRELAANPLDPDNSSALSVFEGDMTAIEQSSLDKKLPYAIILGLPEVVGSRMLNGNPNLNVTLDIVFRHHGQGGNRPNKAILEALRYQTLRLCHANPPIVTELAEGLSLAGPLVYLSGTLPASAFAEPTVLTCTLRFRAQWNMRL